MQEQQRPQQISYTSSDAPPLDFSFKNIKSLEQLKTIQPRQGQRKNIDLDQQKQKQKGEQQIEQQQKKLQIQKNNDDKTDKKKNQITRLLPQNNINSVVTSMITASNLKNISTKAKEELQKKKKKVVHVKLICCSLMLSYNKIRDLTGLHTVLSVVMDNYKQLRWIDLSHNYLQNLNYNFSDFPQLKTIYLHCNFFYDLNQLAQLSQRQQLKSLTIHGNPLASIPNFRIYVISLIPQLKKLDSVLISKKQRDNAKFLSSQVKKMPLPKIIQKPPIENTQEEEEKDIGV